MIPPQELKNRSFSRTAKGYDVAEVDEYMDFIVEKYSEIFAQCAKYDKKLRVVSSRISEIQQEEDIIRRLSISTQKNCDRLTAEAEEEAKNIILKAGETAEHIIGEAKEDAQTALARIEQKAAMLIESTQEKSDALLLSARTRCTKLLGDFKKEISLQSENIAKIKNISEEFNSKLLSMYKNHLNLLAENTSIPNVELEKLTESGLFESVMRDIRSDAVEIAKKNTGEGYDFEEELEALRASQKVISEAKMEEPQKQSRPFENPAPEEPADDSYEGFEEDGRDEDVKIFDKNPPPQSGEFEEGPYGRQNDYGEGEGGNEDEFAEKPLATYDSDDYVYGNGGAEEDGPYGNYGGGGSNGYEYEDGDAGDDSLAPAAKSKGFFGLFKKKQPKGAKKREEEIDDEEDSGYSDSDSDSDSMDDIFEDLDDDE
ncbi:MAG: DivIVA domain-containing protein [Oscillospiraceae bacterium]|nr:DivIVA domain-containing protein [Oscillospiraceae bacterium]